MLLLDDTSEENEVDAQDNTVSTAIETINKLIKTKKVNTLDFLKYFKVSNRITIMFKFNPLIIYLFVIVKFS